TNSMRLLLATTKEGKIIEQKKYINTTRIGGSVDKNKVISKEGIEKNVEAFCDFAHKAKEYGAEKISAVATSAVREAKNRKDLIQAIYQKTGVNVNIISGEEEAELGYKGVIMGMEYHFGADNMKLTHGESENHGACGNNHEDRGDNHGGCPSGQSFLTMGTVPVVSSETDSMGEPAPVVFPETDSMRRLVPAVLPETNSTGPDRERPEQMGRHPVLVIDIGGGSTELILGEGNVLKKTISLDIGAVRMTERFVASDPVGKEEYEKMEAEIYSIINSTYGGLKCCPETDRHEDSECHPETDRHEDSECYPGTDRTEGAYEESEYHFKTNRINSAHERSKCHPKTDSRNGIREEFECHPEKDRINGTCEGSRFLTPTAVGIGGTITTLAALHQKLDPYNPEKVHNYRLTLEDINSLKEKLLSLTVQQIKQLKGIHPKRADIITAGVTILSIIMKSLDLKEIIVSEYDNLEGMLYSMGIDQGH
ncbi:MAG TPA: hypothetical protein VFC98_03925, partial [Clostridia bacterium]|nr:hypothetical protein [Clostridia bacterium]